MIAAIVFATIVMAQNTPAAPAPSALAATPPADDPTHARRDQLLCKSEKMLGSLIPKKVCYTREDQEQRTQDDKRSVERLQQSQYATFQH